MRFSQATVGEGSQGYIAHSFFHVTLGSKKIFVIENSKYYTDIQSNALILSIYIIDIKHRIEIMKDLERKEIREVA